MLESLDIGFPSLPPPNEPHPTPLTCIPPLLRSDLLNLQRSDLLRSSFGVQISSFHAARLLRWMECLAWLLSPLVLACLIFPLVLGGGVWCDLYFSTTGEFKPLRALVSKPGFSNGFVYCMMET